MKVLLCIYMSNHKKKTMDNKEKRAVQIEIDGDASKLTTEGMDKDEKVVMREEISEDDQDSVTGGHKADITCSPLQCPVYHLCPEVKV